MSDRKSASVIVTGAGSVAVVICDNRRYVLRPITFGEAATLAEAEAAEFHGGPAMLTEALRQAVEAHGGADAPRHLAALDAHEEAEIQQAAVLAAQPHEQEPPEAWTQWRAERTRAHATLMRADVARQRVVGLVGAMPQVVAARLALDRARRARAVGLLRLTLVEWSGREGEARPTPELLERWPEADFIAVYQRAEALRRPGVPEGKA